MTQGTHSFPICNSGMRIFNRDSSSSLRQLPVRTALNAEDPTLSLQTSYHTFPILSIDKKTELCYNIDAVIQRKVGKIRFSASWLT